MGRVESAVLRLGNIESKLEKVESHETRIGTLEFAHDTQRGLHKRLEERVDDLADKVR